MFRSFECVVDTVFTSGMVVESIGMSFTFTSMRNEDAYGYQWDDIDLNME